MYKFIVNGGNLDNIPLYNCSAKYETPEEWTENEGTPHPILGRIDLVYGVSIEICYILCIIVILQKDNIRSPSFKIMFLLGIVDMLAIGVNSIATGIFSIEGAVYCSHPAIIIVLGAFGLGLWCSACMICLILAFNRIIEILYPTKQYFAGYPTVIALILPVIYGLYFTFLTPPLFYTSKFQAWFFDPFVVQTDEQFENYPHTINNLLIVAATCGLYGLFCSSIAKKLKNVASTSNSRLQNQIFIQTTIICMINFSAAILYVYMQFFPVADFAYVLAQMLWQLSHGCPAVIYLVMNTTIKNGVANLFFQETKKSMSAVSANVAF